MHNVLAAPLNCTFSSSYANFFDSIPDLTFTCSSHSRSLHHGVNTTFPSFTSFMNSYQVDADFILLSASFKAL